MFKTKYTVSILNVKWEPIKNNLKLKIIPNQGELIYLVDKYYRVISVIHRLSLNHDIFIVIDELFDQPTNNKLVDNQIVK